jgi:hypothetical protein
MRKPHQSGRRRHVNGVEADETSCSRAHIGIAGTTRVPICDRRYRLDRENAADVLEPMRGLRALRQRDS